MNPRHRVRPTVGLRLGLLLLAVAGFHCNDGTGMGERPTLPGPDQLQGPGAQLRQQARLNGRYVQGVRLEASQTSLQPGQPLTLRFLATGLTSVKQFEFVVQLDPLTAFDLSGAAFVPDKPFTTYGAGIEPVDQGKLRVAGALLSRTQTVQGDQGLGSLTVKASSSYSSTSQPRVQILYFSIGPTSTERDSFDDQQLQLGLALQ